MSRIPLITRDDDLDAAARSTFDRIVESRGAILRPFQVLLHSPEAARAVAELGHVLRFGAGLADVDRELATLATGRARGCSYVWDSHVVAAAAAGVSPDAIATLEGDPRPLGEREQTLIGFVQELCATGSVSDRTFGAAHAILGTTGAVELALTVGYYTMLGAVMGACAACGGGPA